MKPNAQDFAMLVVVAFAGVGFYLELAVWDPHGWSRNSLGILALVVFGVAYLGWQAWRWWRRRNSD